MSIERVGKRKRIRLTLLILLFGTLTAAGVGLGWPRERLLTDVAHPILKLKTESVETLWLSAHQLLLVTTTEEPELMKARNGVSPSSGWKGVVELFDTATGVQTPLPRLTDLLQGTLVSPGATPGNFATSPDGAWILWYTAKRSSRGAIPHVTSHVAQLDGAHYRTWYHSALESAFFLDSRRLGFMTLGKPGITLCSLYASTPDQKISTMVEADAIMASSEAQHPNYITAGEAEDANAAGAVEIGSYRNHDSWHHYFFSSRQPQNPLQPFQKHILQLPVGAKLQSSEASPQQQFLWYHLQTAQTPPFFVWLHRLFPNLSVKPVLTESLWISRPDGKGMQELGYVLTHPDADGDPEDLLGNIQWLPDGKMISFVYHGTLYVLPVNTEK